MIELKDLNFLVMDTETTGTGDTDTPVEIAYVLTNMTGPLVAGQTLVNPGVIPVKNEARAVHHIDPAELVGQPTLREALKLFGAQLSAHEIHAYAAHFAEFDSRMVPMLRRQPWLCTCRFAQRLYPELPHHGNQYLRYELGLDVPEALGLPAHRALADAYVTAALLRHMLQRISDPAFGWPQNLEDLIKLVQGPQLLPICPFNKHKGKTWEQVAKEDRGYIEWLLKPKADQKPLDADLRYTLEHWLGPKMEAM